MGKGKEVKEGERAFVVGMAKGGAPISKIVEETKRPKRTVATISGKYRLRGNVQTAKRCGRPPKTTPRDHRHLEKLVKEDLKAPLKGFGTKMERADPGVSQCTERTTRRRLKSLGHNGRQARKKSFISVRNKKRRLNWASQTKGKTVGYWKAVFTDE